jgi:hypothetical protein
MRTQLVILAAAALLMGSGAALAQTQTPRGNDTSGAFAGSRLCRAGKIPISGIAGCCVRAAWSD